MRKHDSSKAIGLVLMIFVSIQYISKLPLIRLPGGTSFEVGSMGCPGKRMFPLRFFARVGL